MSAPTIYFPENIYYRIGFRQGRLWNTVVTPAPTGRQETRKVWTKPKRQLQAQVFLSEQMGEGIATLPADTSFEQYIYGTIVKPFLNLVAGRYRNFWIFGPRQEYLYGIDCGHWNGAGAGLPVTLPGDLPLTLPFRGPWLPWSSTGIPLPGSIPDISNVLQFTLVPVGGGSPGYLDPGDFALNATSFDNLTGGGETVLQTISNVRGGGGPPAASFYLFADAVNSHERIPAVFTTDAEGIELDWTAAEPPVELVLDIEEDFG